MRLQLSRLSPRARPPRPIARLRQRTPRARSSGDAQRAVPNDDAIIERHRLQHPIRPRQQRRRRRHPPRETPQRPARAPYTDARRVTRSTRSTVFAHTAIDEQRATRRRRLILPAVSSGRRLRERSRERRPRRARAAHDDVVARIISIGSLVSPPRSPRSPRTARTSSPPRFSVSTPTPSTSASSARDTRDTAGTTERSGIFSRARVSRSTRERRAPRARRCDDETIRRGGWRRPRDDDARCVRRRRRARDCVRCEK